MEGERDFYQDYAYAEQRKEAAKLLAAKRNERDQLLFRGEPEWKHRNSLKAIDGEIKKLEEDFARAGREIPAISEAPLFKLSEANLGGSYPAPPPEGGEYRFCRTQKADAFLEGRISEFHGRIYLSVKLYALYSRSFLYEDGILFSTEDTVPAMNELAGRLVAVAAGSEPALIAVHAGPEDARITINGVYAGRGEISPREYPPGEARVDIFAEGRETVSLPLALRGGELAELYINLRPLSREALRVEAPEQPGTLVYRGALYLGEAPLSLTMPSGGYEYLTVETPGGETGRLVVQGSGGSGEGPAFVLKTAIPPGEDEKPVDRARRRFYGAYGRFWIALPVAFILGGVYNAYLDAYNNNVTQEMYDEAMKYWYISTGATVLAGLALTETFYRIYRYVRTSDENTAPPVRR
jgi:hypothetical protein